MSWHLARSLRQLWDEVDERWPGRSKASDGWIGDTSHQARKSDHNPDYSAPGNRKGVVRALDITASGIDVDLLIKHTTNDSRVAYVIHNREIYQHSTGWQKYNGSNPHTSHIHISIAHTRDAETNTKEWFGSAPPVSKSPSAPAKKSKSRPSITDSIVDYLNSQGRDSSFSARKSLARTYGIVNYQGTAKQNTLLLNKVRAADAKKPGSNRVSSNPNDPNNYTIRSEKEIRELLLKRTTGTSKNTTPHLIGLYQRQQISPFKLLHDQIWGKKTDNHFRWVGQLQKHMNEWKGTKLKVDGNYGSKTHARVLEIQQNNVKDGPYKGYNVDGFAGPVFCKMIGIKSYPN